MNKKYTVNGREEDPLILFAHGAGAGSDSDFMNAVAEQVAGQGFYVVRFNFPYMEKRLEDGKKRPPDRAPKLLDSWRDVISDFNRPCVIAGKSMGGRMASLLAAEHSLSSLIKGCICLGYPFHPLGKPEVLRTEHLHQCDWPLLILQGSRDKMGNRDEVAQYQLDDRIDVQWLPDADHDLKPRKRSGFTHQRHIQASSSAVAEFSQRVLGK